DIGGTVAGDPEIQFDSTDVLVYDRTNNLYNFRIGGSTQVNIDSTGLTCKQLTASAATNQIVLRGSSTVTINAAAPTSTVTYTIPDSYQTFTPNNFIMSSCRTPQYSLNFWYSPIYSNTYSTTSTVSAHDMNKGITYSTPAAAITLTTDTATAINNEIGNGSAPPY